MVKRILALPGQELEQRNGYLIRSGELVEEPYLSFRDTRDDGPWSATDGYLCLGDNRSHSRDSRLWGTVQTTMFRGRVLGGMPLSK